MWSVPGFCRVEVGENAQRIFVFTISERELKGSWGWRWGEPLPQGFVDAVTGFGDGVFAVVTLGIGNLSEVRQALDIDGGVDTESGIYNGFDTAGNIVGGVALGGVVAGYVPALGPSSQFIGHPAYGGRTVAALRSGYTRFGWGRHNGPMMRLGIGNRHINIMRPPRF